MADYSTFKRGGKEYPLADSGQSLLRDADPFVFYALEFFQKMIEVYVGDRLMAALGPDVTLFESPVAYTVAIDPVPFLTSAHFKFPLLSVVRRNGRLEDRTVGWRHDVTTFEAHYILPPLTPAQAERLVPILTAVRDVLDDRIEYGFDPNYAPTGGAMGDSFWVEFAGVEKAELREAEWGLVLESDTLAFYGIKLRGQVMERSDTPSTGFETFAGADIAVDHASPDGSRIADFVQAATEQPPTLTAISPASGGYEGGTSITLTGTLFYSPVNVLIGGLRATDIVRVSATSITCTTPEHDVAASGTALDVVVETDFGSAALAEAFTLT